MHLESSSLCFASIFIVPISYLQRLIFDLWSLILIVLIFDLFHSPFSDLLPLVDVACRNFEWVLSLADLKSVNSYCRTYTIPLLLTTSTSSANHKIINMALLCCLPSLFSQSIPSIPFSFPTPFTFRAVVAREKNREVPTTYPRKVEPSLVVASMVDLEYGLDRQPLVIGTVDRKGNRKSDGWSVSLVSQ